MLIPICGILYVCFALIVWFNDFPFESLDVMGTRNIRNGCVCIRFANWMVCIFELWRCYLLVTRVKLKRQRSSAHLSSLFYHQKLVLDYFKWEIKSIESVFCLLWNWQNYKFSLVGKCITSLCWRPDGKAIAVGLEDGTISLHDVEVSSLAVGHV